jgi:phage major head subunit gpT-like protein
MSDLSLLSSRAIMGMYFARLETDPGLAWLNGVSNLFTSDQGSETYKFLGQSPAMREWVGGRHAKGFGGQGITIVNKHYEATIEIAKRDARRDKTSQIEARVAEFADRAVTHWASLVSTAILAAPSTVCYDGSFYFDTTHAEGSSGTQNNDIQVDISALPGAGTDNTPSAPNTTQMQLAIFAGIKQILSFKDDQGEPMNENARRFLVLVPVGLYDKAVAAVSGLVTGALMQNFNPSVLAGLQIDVQMNARLTWTDSFAVFRTDSPIKGLIRQTEQEVELKAKAEGSEFEFDNDAWQFGIDAWRGVGYGYWQRACYVTMI